MMENEKIGVKKQEEGWVYRNKKLKSKQPCKRASKLADEKWMDVM